MSARVQRTIGLLLLALGVGVIALGRFSALLPRSAIWIGLGAIVAAWLLIGYSFRSPKAPEP